MPKSKKKKSASYSQNDTDTVDSNQATNSQVFDSPLIKFRPHFKLRDYPVGLLDQTVIATEESMKDSFFQKQKSGIMMHTALNDLSESEKGVFFEEITSFLKPFYETIAKGATNLSAVLKQFDDFMKEYDEEKKKLMDIMDVKYLVCAWISIDMNVQLISTYNNMSPEDPNFPLYAFHPTIGSECRKLGIFLDQFDTVKEAIVELVWSTVDNLVVCLSNVGALPFPLCWMCDKNFGVLTCSRCNVGKYCSKECQVSDWRKHKNICQDIEGTLKGSKQGQFRYDY